MRCAIHPNVETTLRCGKCGQPICPKCLVQTPVGARCPKCANVKKLPIFEVPKTFYIRALAAGLGIGAILGAVWYFIFEQSHVRFIYLDIIIGIAVGYAIGEIISLAVNRKRGRGLQIIAAVSVIECYLIKTVIFAPGTDFLNVFSDIYGLLAMIIGVVVAIARLR